MQQHSYLLTIILSSILLFACNSQEKVNTVLPSQVTENIISNLKSRSKLYKQLRVGDSLAIIPLKLKDSTFNSEFAFIDQHFNISDKKLEGKWKKNTMVKDERNIVEEYLGESDNPFQSVVVKKKSASIQEIQITSNVSSVFGDTKYKLIWKKSSVLQYHIQKEGHAEILFTYCVKPSC